MCRLLGSKGPSWLAVRTASGRSLNPAAPSFMPKAPPVAAAVERESPADAVKRESPADAVKRESPAVAVERDSPEGGGSQMPPCEVAMPFQR